MKYIAWDSKEKRMVEVNMLYFPHTGNPYPVWGDARDNEGAVLGRYKLREFTGLRDKNGKEIYEGDVMQAKYFSGGTEYEHLAVMTWDEKDTCFYWRTIKGLWDTWMGIEIIGNIYENPE